MRRVLVLGGGQVGTFAARALVSQGAAVLAADLSPAPGYFARFGPREGAELVAVDIQDNTALEELIETHAADTIVLSAGLVGAACASDPARAWAVNVGGAEQVARVALATGVKRLVYISSLAVYGRPAVDRVSEEMPIQPQSEYGRTKAAAESILTGLRDKGLDVLILRPCGTYGPLRLGMGSHSARFIESLLLCAVNGRPKTIRAAPNTADEYLYIKDLARAITLVALHDTSAPQFVFNVGWGSKTTAEDLLQALETVAAGARFRIEVVDDDQGAAMPPLDLSLINRVFGFAPRYGLIDGLRDYLQETGLQQ